MQVIINIMLLRIFIVLLFLGSFGLADGAYMLDFRLKSLKSIETVDLETYRGKWLFVLFFEANCRWCHREMQAFENLKKGEHGDAFNVVAVGIGQALPKLKRMANRFSFPALESSETLMRAIGGVKMTPYTLVADPEGNFKTKIVGYQKPDALKKILHQLIEEKR